MTNAKLWITIAFVALLNKGINVLEVYCLDRYRVVVDEFEYCEGGNYTAYGIACDDQDMVLPDISQNRTKIYSFVKLINDNDLQPVHIMDVVEDFLDELQ